MNQEEHQLDYMDLVTLRILDADEELADAVSQRVNLRYGVVRQTVEGVGFSRIVSLSTFKHPIPEPVLVAHRDYLTAMFKRDFASKWYRSNGTLKRVRSEHVRHQLVDYFEAIPGLIQDIDSGDWQRQARAYSFLAHGF